MSAYLPKFEGTEPFTRTTSADVVGGRLLSVSGANTVANSGADVATVIGVAGDDALSGASVTVYPRPGGVHPLVAAGAIAAGAKVISAAGGKVATIGGGSNPIGIALEAAAADLDVIDVLFI
jgi:hypothetical protein